jgi:hypothetical protein
MVQTGSMKTYEKEEIDYDILDEVFLIGEYEGGKKYKKLIRKIKYHDDNEIGYLFGYYYWDIKNNNWHWGRKSLMLSQDEMDELLRKARDKGFY